MKMKMLGCVYIFIACVWPLCSACPGPIPPPTLTIRNLVDGRQVEGFVVTKHDTSSPCNSNNEVSYTAPKGGEASILRSSCGELYVTAKLKVPITPTIGQIPSFTLPNNEEQCRTWTSDLGFGIGILTEVVLYVKRNEEGDCSFSTTP